MNDTDRFRLLGTYKTPRCRVGRSVRCLLRGEVQVAGIHDAPILWPFTKVRGHPTLIVYADLVKAVRRESEIAVAHWWGVSPQTVWKWRKALGVGATTRGTSRLRSDYTDEPWATEAWAKRYSGGKEAERREKIAAAKRGKPRPRHVIEAMRDARLGSHHSDDTRQRMSDAHKTRGTWPPAAGRPWTREEAALLGTIPDEEIARRIGRTTSAVKCRRIVLDIASFFRKRRRKPGG